jgi:Exostosin family
MPSRVCRASRRLLARATCLSPANSVRLPLASSPPPLHTRCPGDGFSTRADDAILSGCLPVVICDNTDEKFAHVVDWSAFSVRVLEKDIIRLPQILTAISKERIAEMQVALSKVWNR